MSRKINLLKVAAAVIVVVVGFFIYSYFKGPSAPEEALLTVEGGGVGQEFTAFLADLQAIKFDQSFFNDDLFRGFRDFSVPIAEQPVGRPNPFAPLPGRGKSK